MKNTSLLLIPIILFLHACSLSLDEEGLTNPNELAETLFDDSFDFSTARVVDVHIEDDGNVGRVFQVLALNPEGVEEVVAEGRTIKGTLDFSLNLPSYLDYLTIKKFASVGGESTRYPITNNEVQARFFNIQSSQSSFCVDHLYAVNGKKGFYKLDVSDDAFGASPLPTLEGGGSIACALDQSNQMVYYNVGKDLYRYDIQTKTFEKYAVGNPFNGNYPRMELKDDTLYISNGTTLYTVDIKTNEVLNTYQIEGFINNSSGGDIAFGTDGVLYLACFSGLYKFTSFSDDKAYIIRVSAENFPHKLTSMAIDRQNRIFVGTNDSNSKLIEMSTADGSFEIVKEYDFTINDLTAWKCEQAELNPDDNDGDGIINELDAYPDDSQAAFNVYTPSKIGMGTLAFEDLWPSAGDYDFNDLVVRYRATTVTNSDNKAVRLILNLEIAAVGAINRNGLGIELPVNADKVTSVSGYHFSPNSNISLLANGTEYGHEKAVIIAFDDAHYEMSGSFEYAYINTEAGGRKADNKALEIIIEFTEPIDQRLFNDAPFNPFIFVGGDRTHEIHLPNKAPTAVADNSLFNQEDDRTDEASGKYYRDENNAPWAIHTLHTFRQPRERTRITQAYNRFLDWASSNGLQYQDWYSDRSGYRNTQHIYLD
ncbi:MAG: LruC domain-containing protein [Bacteroidota bacterium]